LGQRDSGVLSQGNIFHGGILKRRLI